MFFHNFKYTFKILLKNKPLVFWAIVWPLILGTLFNMAFSNMTESENLNIIKLGVVDNSSYRDNEFLKSTISELSNKNNSNKLFNTTYSNEKKLSKLLEKNKIDGYILIDDNVNIKIKENGINQTIIKYVVDEVEEYQNISKNIIEYQIKSDIEKNSIPNVENIYNNVIKKLSENKNYLNDKTKDNMDFVVIEYYTLIAMACLYAALISSEAIKNYLGNLNKNGARATLAPIKRISLIMSGFLASFIIQMTSLTVLLLYTKFILNVDYGSRIILVILLGVIGSMAGLSLGVLIGSIPFKNDGTRIGIANIIVMLGCFFAGMMGITMKYVIDSNIPIINLINPASMITDGFYSLYYYENLSRFYFDIFSLVIVIIILLLASCYYLRRKKYDSI